MLTVEVKYFAVLRDRRGIDHESVETGQATVQGLFVELSDRHGFGLPSQVVRYAVNGAFVDAATRLNPGDEVVFIPPVAGG